MLMFLLFYFIHVDKVLSSQYFHGRPEFSFQDLTCSLTIILFLGSMVRTNDDNCPLSQVETPEYADLNKEDCQRQCLNASNCMAYRWHQSTTDRGKFKPCHVWVWTEKDSCKEISHCMSGTNEEDCLKTEDARIFIKSDKCKKILLTLNCNTHFSLNWCLIYNLTIKIVLFKVCLRQYTKKMVLNMILRQRKCLIMIAVFITLTKENS